jgi:hypothetical protein
VLRWYEQQGPAAEEQPPRVDYYLRIPKQDGLGIKLREGRIEAKERCRQYDVARFHNHVTGTVELWQKWSFRLAESWQALTHLITPSSSWIGVRKARRMKRYRLSEKGVVVGVVTGDRFEAGCEVELTQIEAEGELWWSLGLEAFGEESENHGTLLIVARHVFAQGETPALDAENSLGYAQWLERRALSTSIM